MGSRAPRFRCRQFFVGAVACAALLSFGAWAIGVLKPGWYSSCEYGKIAVFMDEARITLHWPVGITSGNSNSLRSTGGPPDPTEFIPAPPYVPAARWGFEFRPRWLVVPLWFPTVTLVLLSCLLYRASTRSSSPGFCSCGYDLTGNVSGRCPECGRGVEKQMPAAELAGLGQ